MLGDWVQSREGWRAIEAEGRIGETELMKTIETPKASSIHIIIVSDSRLAINRALFSAVKRAISAGENVILD